jgi:hypothetical protein
MSKRKYVHQLSEMLPPSTVANMGNNVFEQSTSSFQRIIADKRTYMFTGGNSIEGLNAARNDVRKDGMKYLENGKKVPIAINSKYFYFTDHFFTPGSFKKFCQIDIRSAYWEISKKKGYISSDTYGKHKLNKIARNMALGTWAVCTTKSVYKKGKLIDTKAEYKPTRPLFFDTAQDCFNLMKNAVHSELPNVPFFFWVDAIFCPVQFAPNIRSFISNEGFDTSFDPVNIIISNGELLHLYMNGKRKEFNLPKFNRLNNF